MTADQILQKHEDANEMHFHQVDREWIIQAMEEYATFSQTEISDEEIIKSSERENKYEFGTYSNYNAFREGWINAIEWYREQLKSRQ